MKRLIGWLILAARLHSALRAARAAVGQVGRHPIRVRPVFPAHPNRTRLTSPESANPNRFWEAAESDPWGTG